MTADRVVVLFGSGQGGARATGLPGERSLLQKLLEDGAGDATVCIVSLGMAETPSGVVEHVALDDDGESPVDRVWRALGAYALRDALARSPLGRLLNSMGPVDQGRVFWRSVKRSPRALALIRSSDVAIAADLPAVKCAWLARRRGWVSAAHYDHRSASLGVAFQLPPG